MKKSFLKKIGLIFCLGVLLLLLDACYALSCICPDGTKEFFDFQSVSTELHRDTVTTGRIFEATIRLEDKEFLAEAVVPACRRPWFINSALACTCIEEGERGLKFPVTEFRVFSNADYSEDISAGDSLSDIVKIGEQKETLSNIGDKNRLFNIYSDIELAIETSPSVDSTHTFTIEIVKENGTVLSVEMETVSWY